MQCALSEEWAVKHEVRQSLAVSVMTITIDKCSGAKFDTIIVHWIGIDFAYGLCIYQDTNKELSKS